MKLSYGFHGADLFSGMSADEMADYDEDASIERYAELLQEAIEAEYPDAEVEVPFDRNTGGVLPYDLQAHVYLDDDEDPEDEEYIRTDMDWAASNVYNSWAWVVFTEGGLLEMLRSFEELQACDGKGYVASVEYDIRHDHYTIHFYREGMPEHDAKHFKDDADTMRAMLEFAPASEWHCAEEA